MKTSWKAFIFSAALVGAFLLTFTFSRFAMAATPLPEWSNSSIDVTPNGQIFLGQFGSETVILSLPTLPDHSQVTVTLRLFVIGAWGSYDGSGTNYWYLGVTDSTNSSFFTTFSNFEGENQAYPDAFRSYEHPAWTGASGVNTLGYGQDSVYEVIKTFDHTGNTLQVNFGGENLYTERWGLDYVKVEVGSQVVYENDFDNTIAATNDLQANASVISALPFKDMIDTREATASADDPATCAGANSHSVWYSYTPDQDRLIEVNSDGSNFPATIAVFSESKSSFSQVACGGGSVLFDAVAGNTYFIMVGGDGGILRLRVDQPFRLTTKVTGGAVDRIGNATISGTIECTKYGSVGSLSGNLAQRAGRFRVISGSFFIKYFGTGCSPTEPVKWSAKVTGDGPFNPGPAIFGARVSGCGGAYCDFPDSEATIHLKKQ